MNAIDTAVATAIDGRISSRTAVNISSVSIGEAQRLIGQVYQECPYSNNTRNNIEVKFTTANN